MNLINTKRSYKQEAAKSNTSKHYKKWCVVGKYNSNGDLKFKKTLERKMFQG